MLPHFCRRQCGPRPLGPQVNLPPGAPHRLCAPQPPSLAWQLLFETKSLTWEHGAVGMMESWHVLPAVWSRAKPS